MSQINLIDAIRHIMNCMEQFTDMQLKKFLDCVTAEIDKRKGLNDYNPGVKALADDADKKTKKKKENL